MDYKIRFSNKLFVWSTNYTLKTCNLSVRYRSPVKKINERFGSIRLNLFFIL